MKLTLNRLGRLYLYNKGYISTHTHTPNTTTTGNEKKIREFERTGRGIWEGLQGGNDIVAL